ncbi:hypothetical protein B0H10DRAFT_2347097 [Mycena sp. CBHHK59/15]|nr:hypothetical protein B0H10DRAFT_2347097 [Mycena sp. CBHHK59/15]
MQSVGAPLADIVTQGQAFKDGMVLRWHQMLASDLGLTILACTAVGSVLSKKDSWIAHLIGGKTACQYASAEAKEDATAQRIASKKRAEPDTAGGTECPHKKQQQDTTPIQSTLTGFRRNEMPYGEAEKAAIESQALRAIVSGKVAGGRLCKAAAADVEAITIKALKGTTAGLSTDGWKCKKKNAINAICANSYLIELVEVTALNKDGPALCEQFSAMIDGVEVKYGCIIIYFTTDADGGSKKGAAAREESSAELKSTSPWELQEGIDAVDAVFSDIHKAVFKAAGWVGMSISGRPNPRMGGDLTMKVVCFGQTPAGHDSEDCCVDFNENVSNAFQEFLKIVYYFLKTASFLSGQDLAQASKKGNFPLSRPQKCLNFLYVEYTRVELQFEVKKSFPAEFGENFRPDIDPNIDETPRPRVQGIVRGPGVTLISDESFYRVNCIWIEQEIKGVSHEGDTPLIY